MDPTDFDFWIGTWTCTDPHDGSVGTNVISKVLGGHVVEEVFTITDSSGTTLDGRSHTVLDPQRGWCQTWVDSTGAYLDFTGGPTELGVVLSRPGARMTFREITPEAFTWDWEKAVGDGWELAWRLLYARA